MRKWTVIALFVPIAVATFGLLIVKSRKPASGESAASYSAPPTETIDATSEAAHPLTPEGRKAIKSLSIGESNPGELDHLPQYANLESLTINCLEHLKELPDSLGDLPKLTELRIGGGNGCGMTAKVPESIGKLENLEKLTLVLDYDADELPAGTKPSAGDKAKWLQKFPASLVKLTNLRELEIGSEFTSVPEFVEHLTNLRTLDMNYNDLSDLPDFLQDLPHLKEVSLQDNCLILNNMRRQKELRKRFPHIQLNFSEDEPVCEGDNS